MVLFLFLDFWRFLKLSLLFRLFNGLFGFSAFKMKLSFFIASSLTKACYRETLISSSYQAKAKGSKPPYNAEDAPSKSPIKA
jgi:hypothetical protein